MCDIGSIEGERLRNIQVRVSFSTTPLKTYDAALIGIFRHLMLYKDPSIALDTLLFFKGGRSFFRLLPETHQRVQIF